MKTKTTMALTTLAAVAALTACDRGLETRTYRIEHLQAWEVNQLLEPYVYGEREGAPGSASASESAITVRETPENLRRIEQVLAEFDVPRPDVRLFFQLIEADGFTESDPRIADVEDELRKLFRFQGYRLAGEATVTVTDQADFHQGLRAEDGLFELYGDVYRTGGGSVRLGDVTLEGTDGWRLQTSVNVSNGQTLVLGSQPKGETNATLFLTVRAESSGGADRE